MTSFTVALIKAPTVGRGHVSAILRRITQHGFYIAAFDRYKPCGNTVEAFYHEHVDKPYFENLQASMDGDVVAMVLGRHDGKDVVHEWRGLIGSTRSAEAKEGTIRAEFGGHRFRGETAPIADNAVHGSDSRPSATYEYSVFFSKTRGWPEDPNVLVDGV